MSSTHDACAARNDLSDLPAELASIIVSFIPVADRGSVRLTCKAFYGPGCGHYVLMGTLRHLLRDRRIAEERVVGDTKKGIVALTLYGAVYSAAVVMATATAPLILSATALCLWAKHEPSFHQMMEPLTRSVSRIHHLRRVRDSISPTPTDGMLCLDVGLFERFCDAFGALRCAVPVKHGATAQMPSAGHGGGATSPSTEPVNGAAAGDGAVAAPAPILTPTRLFRPPCLSVPSSSPSVAPGCGGDRLGALFDHFLAAYHQVLEDPYLRTHYGDVMTMFLMDEGVVEAAAALGRTVQLEELFFGLQDTE